MLLRLLLIPVTLYIGYRITRFLLWLRKLNKALADVPTMPNAHWLIGNIGQIRAKGSFVDARAEAFDKLGVGTMKVYLGPVPILVTRDLDFFKYVHINQTGSPTPFVRVYAPMMNRALGDSAIVASDGDAWRFHRKNLEPLFRHQNLNAIFPMLMEHCDRVEQLWLKECDKNPVTRSADINIKDQMKDLSTGIIAYLAFSTDLGVLKTEGPHPAAQQFTNLSETMEHLGLIPPILQMIPWIPERRRLEEEITKADSAMLDTIKMRRKSNTAPQVHQDVLDLLLADHTPPYTDRWIRDQCMTLYWAGQETTALLMSWGLYYLARYPKVQETLYEALQDLPQPYTLEHLNRIPYLTYFVNETLRFTAIVPSELKESSTDKTNYQGLQLPAGLWVLSSLHDMLRNPEYFPDPQTFDPERWTDPKRHSMDAFVAFTKGEKMCIGQKLALMEGKAILAHALQKFQFSETPGFKVVVKRTFLARPADFLKVRVSVRS